MKKPPSFKYLATVQPLAKTWKWKGACLLLSTLFVTANSWSAISGNYYDLGNGNTAVVNPPPIPPATTPALSAQWVTFTATEDGPISEAQIYNSTAITGSPVLEVGLYAVDSAGKPAGSALSSNSITPSGTGWQTASLSYTLVKGTVYALRVSTATSGTSYPWRLNFAPTGNNIQPSGVVDTHWQRGNNSTNPANSSQNVWILKTGTNQAIGQPYTISNTQNLAGLSSAVGQRFRFDAPSTGETLLESVSLKLNVSATPPTNPVIVKLLDKNGLVITTGSIDLSSAVAGLAYFNIELATAQQLTAGEFYYLAAYSAGSTTNSVYWAYGSTTNDPLYQSATYQGTDAYAASWNSQSTFGTPTATDLSRDYFFQLNLNAVPEPTTWALLGLGLMVWTFARRQRSA